jgi:hypothetical protein
VDAVAHGTGAFKHYRALATIYLYFFDNIPNQFFETSRQHLGSSISEAVVVGKTKGLRRVPGVGPGMRRSPANLDRA